MPRLDFTWPHLLLPVLFLIGTGSVFAVIPGAQVRLIFLIFAAVTFYVLELKLGVESHFLQNIFLLSVLGWYVGLFALKFYVNFPTIWLAQIWRGVLGRRDMERWTPLL